MDNAETIHLLILIESSHDAEVLASSLRNAGYAVRHKHAEDEGDIAAALAEQNWDLLISAPKVDTYTAEQALEFIRNAGKDLPCIVFGGDNDRATTLKLIQAGAADCVPMNEQAYLLAIINRELKNLYERRAHRACRISLNETEKRNRSLLDSSRDSIAYIHEGMHIYANISYLEMFGYEDTEEIESIPIMDLIDSEHQQAFKKVLRELDKGDTPDQEFEFQATRSDGEKFKAIMQFSPASIDGEACTQVVILALTDSKQLEKELEQLRKQDLLTGLYNRQYFMDELASTINQANKGQTNSTLLYIEPDNFKHIKETLGIAGSDIVLTDMANILREATDDKAILARFAGTIFTIILPGATAETGQAIAEKIRVAFEKYLFEIDTKTVTTTCSIGLIPVTETTPDAKKALTHADTACAIAKNENNNKGNAIHTHTAADQLADMETERAWSERISMALTENRFTLHFQPIVSLHAEPGERYDILLRMHDKDNNLIMPGEFLPHAESARMMTDIDRWVLKTAAKALLEKRRDGKELRLFIKLSSDTITDASFLPWMSKLLKAARLHGSSFVFQVSESAALNNIKVTRALINGLTQLHCLFALDHVGNASETLDYLNHFHVNYLKIDGAHIANISDNEASQELVKTITEIAREKEILTIAEHVQDPACLAALWQHGVNFIQGYYLQHPENNMNYDFTAEE